MTVRTGQPDESLLIGRILNGERELYRNLVAEHQNLVFSMIMRRTGDHALAEELTHETFVKAYFNLASFRAGSKFSTWLVTIALNHTSSYYASKAHKERTRSVPFELAHHDRHDQTIEEEQRLRERLTRFRSCIGKLGPKFQEIITLCGLEGRTYEDAAGIVGVPVGTVRSRLNKARLLVRECLSQTERLEQG